MPRVLIVEDDELIAKGMATHLAEAGFDPLWMGNGEAGLARLRFERPDVCVLDLMLPLLDGWKLIETARAEGIGTPIVVVSARGSEQDRVHALEIGADDYLVKPFSMSELVARVRVAARRGVRAQEVQRGETIEIEELVVDPRSFQAYVDGENVALDADRVPAPVRPRLRAGPRPDEGRAAAEDLGPPADEARPDGRRLRPQAAREDRQTCAAALVRSHSVRRGLQAGSTTQGGGNPRGTVGLVTTVEKEKASVEGPERFLNRELSSLDFNARVLELAADPSLPLLERLTFCSRFSQHLDEFFAVRVSGLMGQDASGLTVHSLDGRTPQQTLAEIRERVLALSAEQSSLWKRELRPALEKEGILIGRIADCSEKELEELAALFDREIYPVLTPLAVGPGQPFPYISALSLSLGVFVRDPKTGEERFARVKVPELLPRFIGVGKRHLYLPLEHVITYSLTSLFPKMEISECAPFRVTRDADFEVSDEADDLLEAVELELQRRRFGGTVRVEISESMSDEMLRRIKAGLGARDDQVYRVDGLLDLADLNQIVDLDRPDLKEERWRGVTQPRLAVPTTDGELFDEIKRGDILVHLPYESFVTSVETFVQAAARDPDVIAIKTTVYRTSDESPLVPALIEAADAGKQTVCLVELKARFDERQNIEWSRALERSGVHVVYGFPTLKTHAKMILVVRREGNELRRYVHVGTGNYHALTARGYEDFGLFTTDESIASDVADLFNYMTGFGRPQRFRKVLVAPFTLRTRLIEAIRSVAQVAEAGKKGLNPHQGQLTHGREGDRGAVRRLSGGGRDRDRLPVELLAAPGGQGPEREHPRQERRRPLSRTQPRLRARGRRQDDVPDGELRPDAAQPRPSARGRRARRRHPSAPAGKRDVRRPSLRQHELVGAARGRLLEAD